MQNVLIGKSIPIIKNYSFRYLDSKHNIYYISKTEKNRPKNFYSSLVYTRPFHSKEKNETRNVLIGYISKDMGDIKVHEFMDVLKDEEYDLVLKKMSLEDFKHLSSILRTPLIVILNSFCEMKDHTEQYELFYYFNQQRFSASPFIFDK